MHNKLKIDAIKYANITRLVVGIAFVGLVYIVQFESGFSAFVGVLASVIPEAYQGWKISKLEKEFEPTKWLRMTYQSIISKWLMTAMIFAISFSSVIEWDYKILFIGYLLVSLSGLLTPIFIGKK